jgi:hypothetical protein
MLLAGATGWNEEYIMNELPIARANQYIHAILMSKGANTVPTSAALRQLVTEVANG